MRGVAFIFVCCICFVLWQSTEFSPIKTLSIYKIGSSLVIFWLVKEKIIKVFCLTYAAAMAYPWFPHIVFKPCYYTDSVHYLTYMEVFHYIFLGVWFLTAIGIVINSYFSNHG